MGQKSQLWPDLPALDTFELNRRIYEVDEDAYHRTLDELTGLLDVRALLQVQVRRLSLGERMKMELIAALLHRPDILYPDEPTIGLDILSQRSIRDFLKYYNEQTRTTLLLTSHYTADIEALCPRSIIINHGSVVFDGPLAEVSEVFGHKKLIALKAQRDLDPAGLARFGAVRECRHNTALLEVDRDGLERCLPPELIFGDSRHDGIFLRNHEGCDHCRSGGQPGLWRQTVVAEVVPIDSSMLAMLREGDMEGARGYWRDELHGMTYFEHARLLLTQGILDPVTTEDQLSMPIDYDLDRDRQAQKLSTKSGAERWL